MKPSKLTATSTDSDLRYRYNGIEPLYYEVLTCPHCLYSALHDVFNSPDNVRQDILRELEPFKNVVQISAGANRDADSVFTGFYLALFCAPISFNKYQLVAAKLLYKLKCIYSDTGDAALEDITARKALDSYLYSYARIGIPPSREQQVCILIGELYYKQSDLKNALSFFNRARSCTSSNTVLKNHAEKRVLVIRGMTGIIK